jgi:hypothetical protein
MSKDKECFYFLREQGNILKSILGEINSVVKNLLKEKELI